MPRITDFCSCIYVFGCKLSLVRFCDGDFGITPVDDITIGITCAAFCLHIAHISFASSWYFIIIIIDNYTATTACLKNRNNIMHVQRNFCCKVTLVLAYINDINYLAHGPQIDAETHNASINVTSQECKARSSG